MEEKIDGWVVVTHGLKFTGKEFIVTSSFARTKKESINLFISGSNNNWQWWYRNYNYRCEKATSIIRV